MKQIHLVITGSVHGVFFRAFVKDTAESLNITGWVKNNSDGSVEAVAQGDDAALKKLAAACHKGPEAANVDSVKTEEQEAKEKFDGFEIIR